MRANHVRTGSRALLSTALLLTAGCADEPLFTPEPALGQAAQAVIAPGPYTPGVSYFGSNEYIEYIPGNLPLIFTAAHGGELNPSTIPDRTLEACGAEVIVTVTDSNTQEMARALQAAFFSRTGKYPHVIINRLSRRKLDANRAMGEAACGNPDAEVAWSDFHAFIDTAKAQIITEHGKGWYADLHGHGHNIARLELGYYMTPEVLRHTDAELDGDPAYEEASSIRTFSQESPLPFSALLRGPTALGALYSHTGYPSVPSPEDPYPEVDELYFFGAYNTVRHGCKDGGQICGVQLEMYRVGVRDNAPNRARFAESTVEVYDEFLSTNFGITLPLAPPPPSPPGTTIVVDNDNANNDLTLARFSASSNWSTTANNQQKYLNTFRLSSGAGAANDGAEWYFYVRTPGTYQVEAWWPAAGTRSTTASYRVFELEGASMLDDLTKNQQIDGGRWNVLGTYTFSMVGWAKVLMSRSLSGSGSLAADAVRATLVTADNRAPVSRVSAPFTVAEGSPASFDGARSFDFEGDPLSYEWSFGDGDTATGVLATHTYVDDGDFDVTLTVTDPQGEPGSASRPVAVTNVAPAVSAGPDATITSGDTFTLSGAFSDPGVEDAPWSWAIDWVGDTTGGTTTEQSEPIVASRQICAAGVHTITLGVTDADSGTGTDTLELSVERYPIGLTMKPHSIRLSGSGGQMLARVRSTPGFDATQLQVETIRLTDMNGSGTQPAKQSSGAWFTEVMDVDGDGLLDLVVYFNRSELIANGDLSAATSALYLLADAADCRQVLGGDAIIVIP